MGPRSTPPALSPRPPKPRLAAFAASAAPTAMRREDPARISDGATSRSPAPPDGYSPSDTGRERTPPVTPSLFLEPAAKPQQPPPVGDSYVAFASRARIEWPIHPAKAGPAPRSWATIERLKRNGPAFPPQDSAAPGHANAALEELRIDPWPALPDAEPGNPDETTARVVALLHERARLERLARDQVERSWNA
jgi:hypothetical protein